MRTLTLSLIILTAWLLLVAALLFGPLLLDRNDHLSRNDIVPVVLISGIALIVGLAVGCFVTRERPFRPELLGVAIIASAMVTFVVFVVLSARHTDTLVKAVVEAMFYIPGICIFSVPAAISCLLAQSCRSKCLRGRR